jgi:ATP-dependent 26S proteasome regulatory subunit
MYGPPGSGKSFIAELFARNESCAYAFVKFETKIYVGSSLAAQEKVLKQAKIILENEKKESEKSSREKRPVVIIMDEIDSIGVKDKTGDHQYMNHQTNGILRMIDEIRRDKLDIILIGITNYPETLDDALIRTGRLGRKICVPHFQEEDVNSLEDIFKKEVKEIN